MKNIVIIGAGHGAGQLVMSLRQKKFKGHITLVGEEDWHPYQRPPLSKKFLSGELSAERLFLKPPAFYDDPSLSPVLNSRAMVIDRDVRQIATNDGKAYDYDALVIATGSRPRQLDVPGTDLDGIHYLRGIDDVNAIRASMSNSEHVSIIGAGYIGLEVAAVTRQLDKKVTVVEMENRVMSRVVSPELSAYYESVHSEHGVQILPSTSITAFAGETRIDGVILDNGETLTTDMVVIGVGIVPNTELAEAAGLITDNGIVVDDHCRTSDASIYAIGDCTWHPNSQLGKSLRLESVHNAVEQAKTAAANLCGKDTVYSQVPWFWSDQYDLKLQIAGVSQGYDEVVLRGDMTTHSFSCLYLRDGKLIAVDAVNAPRDYVQGRLLIAGNVRIDPARLADPNIPLKDLV